MASAFSDQSYSKLPPIRKGSLKDSQDLHEATETDSSHVIDFNREGHGLVRLPPIIRVDSSLNTARQRESQDESRGYPTSFICSENKDSLVGYRQFSSDLSSKQKIYSSTSDLQLHETRRADERKKLEKTTTSDSSDYIRDSHLVKSDIRGSTISCLEIDTVGEHNLDDIKTTSLLNTRQVDRSSRRASLIAPEPQKLHRGRRLAKSSPELSSTRKKYNSPVREFRVASKVRADIDSIAASCSRSDSQTEQLQFDISVNISSKDQESPRTPRNEKARGIPRKTEFKRKVSMKGNILPYSSPCTPVVNLMSDDNLSTREGRQSLGDINNIITPQRAKKTSIVSTRTKQPIRDEIKRESLRVDGKTCPKSERLSSRATSSFRPHQPSRDGFLKPPESRTKRDSLYDLQQILSMLNTEDKSLNPSDPIKRENRSSSVYDLQEFLKMSSFGEQPALVTTNSKQSNNSSVGAESLLIPRVVEPGNRRGSTYDLLEFLSQLNIAAAKNKDSPGRGSEIPANTASAVSHKQTGNAPFLSPGDSESVSSTVRRPSAYDLMEFLSLSRSSQNEEPTNADSTSKTQPSLKLPMNAGSERGEPRKNSVYNLEEFLGLPKTLSTGSMVYDHSGTSSNPNTPLLSPKLPSKFKFKRESIYDLQEFLGILQKEEDGKQSSGQSEDNKTSMPIVHPGMEDQPGKGHTETFLGVEPQKNRSLSIYDLREFLSMYASQSQPSISSQSRGRKASSISQNSIMINVSEDEFGNGSVEDVFLAVPVEGTVARKPSSVSELSELLNVLSDPSRRRSHSNVSSAKSTSSTSSSFAPPSTVSRHDSGGGNSLYDLGEFLNVLNSDDSPLRRRLSSVSDRGNCTPSGLSRNDSSGGSSLYDLEEFLTITNDNGKEDNEKMEENYGQDICIPVPQLPSRSERNGSERMTSVKRTSLTTPRTGLNSVPESTDIVGKANEGRRKSLGHCL